MRRVVVTGMGVVSCLGNSKQEVTEALRTSRSGIRFNPSYEQMGLRSQVSGSVDIDPAEHIDRKHLRFMGDSAAYAYIAMQQAIDDAGLEPSEVSNPRTGIIAGSGGASTSQIIWGADTLRERGVRRLGPYLVPRTMSSSISACLATHFAIKGLNYSITSACATSAHCIGNGCELIQFGKQDVVFAGGGEEVDPVVAPVAGAGEVRNRHEFERSDAQCHQVVELFFNAGEAPLGSKSAHMQFIDDGLFPFATGPGCILPFPVARIDYLARTMNILRLET